MSKRNGSSVIKLDGPEGAMKLEEFLKNNNCVIRFHMYGCFFCNKMEDEWHKLANNVDKSQALVLDVDSEAVRSMDNPMKSSINGFPTIIYSPKGQSEKYSKFEDENARTAENMKSWLDSMTKNMNMTMTIPTRKVSSRKFSNKKTKKALKALSKKLGGGKARRSRKMHKRKSAKKNHRKVRK